MTCCVIILNLDLQVQHKLVHVYFRQKQLGLRRNTSNNTKMVDMKSGWNSKHLKKMKKMKKKKKKGAE